MTLFIVLGLVGIVVFGLYVAYPQQLANGPHWCGGQLVCAAMHRHDIFFISCARNKKDKWQYSISYCQFTVDPNDIPSEGYMAVCPFKCVQQLTHYDEILT